MHPQGTPVHPVSCTVSLPLLPQGSTKSKHASKQQLIGDDECSITGGSFVRMNVQVQFKQEKNSMKLMGKLDREPPALPDIEDCGKSPGFSFFSNPPTTLTLKKNTNQKTSTADSGTCSLCPSEPWDDDLGVQNFPRKPAKKPPRAARSLTCVVVGRGEEGEQQFLLTQRPSKGSVRWAFPTGSLLDAMSSSRSFHVQVCWLVSGSFPVSRMRTKMGALRTKRCCALR